MVEVWKYLLLLLITILLGACLIINGVNSQTIINSSSFNFAVSTEKSYSKGGGIYFEGNGRISINSSNFTDCRSEYWSGGLEMGVSANITWCIFERCWALGFFFFFYVIENYLLI
jgi:hypothetical protein